MTNQLGWQSMDTAPGGQDVLLWTLDHECVVGERVSNGQRTWWMSNGLDVRPRYWQPLPLLPSESFLDNALSASVPPRTILVRIRVVVYPHELSPTGFSYLVDVAGKAGASDHVVWIEADVPVGPVPVVGRVSA